MTFALVTTVTGSMHRIPLYAPTEEYLEVIFDGGWLKADDGTLVNSKYVVSVKPNVAPL